MELPYLLRIHVQQYRQDAQEKKKERMVILNKGIFITFEGGEGSGKSTLVRVLAKLLRQEGFEVVATREPGGCACSERIRDLILSEPDIHPLTEASLYAAARKEHCIDVIAPALNKGYIVLCDRYIHSNMVYQGYCYDEEYGMNLIKSLNEHLQVEKPDLTYFLDVEPASGIQRIQENGRETNRFDLREMDFHEKVYEGFKVLAKNNPDKIKTIDATRPFDEKLQEELVHQIIQLYKNHDRK